MELLFESLCSIKDELYEWLYNNNTIVMISGSAFLISSYVIHRLQLKQPPGPWYLPLLGNVSLFTNNSYLYKSLGKLYKDYGELCYLRFGPYPVILISGQSMIRKMLIDNKEVLSDRACFAPIDRFTGGGKGLIKSNYEENKIYRKFAMKSLRNYGLGKSFFEEKMQNEANILINAMISMEGKPFDPGHLLTRAVANIICMLVMNKRYDYNDKKFIAILNEFGILVEKSGIGCRTFSFLPICIIRKISDTFNKCIISYEKINIFIKDEIKIHEKVFDPENINDFMDLFIKISKETNDKKHVENLQEMIFDLMVAGVETTSSVLRFLGFYLCKFPRVQIKCREEIHKMIGSDKQPSLADKCKLIYNTAMHHELLRLANIGPLALVHTCTKDVTLDGFIYKKDTCFMPNIYSCHMNENTFPEPFEFRPERWIDDDGALITPPLDYMPFGVGPRSCMGDILAKNEIFIFSTTMIQKLEFSYNGKIIEEDIKMGVTRKIRQDLEIIAKVYQ